MDIVAFHQQTKQSSGENDETCPTDEDPRPFPFSLHPHPAFFFMGDKLAWS